jgi:hypothetical protein
MRNLALACAMLLLGACGQDGGAPSRCDRAAAHAVTWSAAAPDRVSARAEGPSCAQATVTLTVRNGSGDPLWAFASSYREMVIGGAPPEDSAPVSAEDMDRFLAAWADVSVMGSAALPQWSADARTDFQREQYEALRARDLRTICYAAGVTASQCLVIDPATNAPAMIVATGE